jgi:hypothetical protein
MAQITAATYLTPVEGEILRAQLGFAGIPASLSNVELVTWFWHLSNAVGGVALHVAAEDASAAEELLRPGDDNPPTALVPWPCAGCGELLPHDWHVCWRCGATAEGDRDPNFLGGPPASPIWHYLHGLDAPGGLVLLLAALVLVFPPALVVIGLWIVIGSISPAPAYADETALVTVSDPNAAADIPAAVTEEGDELCARALRTALFGLCWLAPLLLLSVGMLISFDAAQKPTGPRGRRWYVMAWAINLAALSAYLLLAKLLLASDDIAWDVFTLMQTLRRALIGID